MLLLPWPLRQTTTSVHCENGFSPADVAARITLRQLAVSDADAAFDYYVEEAPPGVAASFVELLERAFEHLSEHPLTGSLRFAFELDIPELRSWPVAGFPYLIFYVGDDSHVDVWRILHARRDIPVFLEEP